MTAIPEADKAYLLALKPKKAPLHWMRLSRCSPGLLGDRGCGVPTRWVYMSGKVRPTYAVCPVCGRRAIFAFWKMKVDHDFKPTPEQEADVRALFADWKAMAKGREPSYGKTMTECILIHCPEWVPQQLVRALIAFAGATQTDRSDVRSGPIEANRTTGGSDD